MKLSVSCANLPAPDTGFVADKVEDVEVCLVSDAVVVERKPSIVRRNRRVL